MKTGVAIAEEDEVLARWGGTEATVWMYHVSCRRMLIRLETKDGTQALFIAASGCERISGPLRWTNAAMAVERTEGAAVVRDVGAAFALECSAVALFIGSATSFETSFEGWLNED